MSCLYSLVAPWRCGEGGLFEGNLGALLVPFKALCRREAAFFFLAPGQVLCGQSNHLFEVAAAPRLMIFYLVHTPHS
jgi:hypothetical protein